MAKHTENYGLTKPEPNNFYDVEVGNNNLDVIDGLIKGSEDAIDDIAGLGRTDQTVVGAYAVAQQAAGQVGSVDEKIGNTDDIGGSASNGTIMAKLNSISTQEGNTVDTIASTTSGTAMGKLNYIINKVFCFI
ncbi:hypothetical protein SDC9_189421 [bioreactor metagenome]|uniref:Trimeric autotransporter adhesin YadA-like stalk domain-containing protein n=1 Tax=bioreactor metagenome TaxID=1076179 RepID=A0A645HTH0_9ZZZZ